MDKEIRSEFIGFSEEEHLIRLPETFFTHLLPRLENQTDLRLLLYLFWHLEQQEGAIRYFLLENLSRDPALLEMIGGPNELTTGLKRLTKISAILEADLPEKEQKLYFINGPQGRNALKAIEEGSWQMTAHKTPIQLTPAQPNIFKLYEENLGPITPMMAEILKEDEADYPNAWIKEAIQIALTRNARNWKYVQAILKRWKTEGRGNEQNRQNDSQDPGSYRESWLGRDG